MTATTDSQTGALAGAAPRARFAPAQAVALAAVASVALFLFEVWLVVQMPWLGLTLDEHTGAGVAVVAVAPDGPAAERLRPGDVIVAFESTAGDRVPVDATTVTRATYAIRSYAEFNAFFERHARLYRAIQQLTVTAVLDDGQSVEIAPAPRRSLASLPADFWAMDLLAAVALLIGAGVLVFQPRELAARMFFLVCAGGSITAAMMALGKSRELTFDADWVGLLWSLDQFGKDLALFGLVALFWVYPRVFRPAGWLVPVALVYLLAFVAGVFQWWPTPRTSAPLIASATLFGGLLPLAAWQWRAARHDPVDRAALKILLAAVLVPLGLIVLTNRLPILLGYRPVVYSGVALAAMLLALYAGFAFGVARYRLFRLDRWWFEALMWGLGGALVVAIDALLLWMQTQAGLALAASLAIAGWIWFPLRQWLWRRVRPEAQQTVERHLPRLIEMLFSAPSAGALADNWRRLLDEVFAPLTVARVEEHCTSARVIDNGRAMLVPGLEGNEAVALSHARKGARLFNPGDADLADALLALTRQARAARIAIDQRAADKDARAREREQLVEELHDGLGGIATNIRLLATIAQRDEAAPAVKERLSTIVELADASLAEIRTFMYSLDDADTDWTAFAADLRAYGRRLTEPHGLAFEMTSAIAPGAPPPDAVLQLHVARICKEALTNVVKHAQAKRVRVHLGVDAAMELVVEDDGVGLPAEPPDPARSASRGLSNLHRRATRIGAALTLRSGPGTTVRLSLPLAATHS